MLERMRPRCFATRCSLLMGGLWALCLFAMNSPAPLAQPQVQDLAAAPAPVNVTEVSIEGLISFEPKQLLPYLKTKPERTYNPIDVRDDVEELSKRLRTVQVQTEPVGASGIKVRFTVTEFPRFRSLQVIGNEKLKTKRVEGLAGLKEGDIIDETFQTGLRRSIENEYKTLGLPQAKVALNLIDVQGSDKPYPVADLQIVLDEGSQVQARDVIIQGNSALSTMKVKSRMETKGSFGFIKNYYADNVFEDDLEKVRQLYYNEGYFDAKVERGSFQVEQHGEKSIVSPVVQITEGSRYKFGEVRVRGARLYSSVEVMAPFRPLVGQPYEAYKFQQALDQLQALYVNHGLLTTEIKPVYAYQTDPPRLDMTIEIKENDRIYVGDIKIVHPPSRDPGEAESAFRRWYDNFAPPVRNEAVSREILLKPGEIYNKQLERDSIKRLSRLGIFNPEKIEAYNEPTDVEGVHNMVVRVEEAVTGAISGGIGYGDASGAFLFAQFAERNIGGRADAFVFNAQLGQRDSSVTATYLDRHYKDSDDSVTYTVFGEQLLRPGYSADQAGIHIERAHPMEDDWRRYIRARFEAVHLDERAGIDAREDIEDTYGVATLRLRFEQDTRAPWGEQPKSGYVQDYSFEGGFAGAPLARFETSRNQYFPVGDKATYRLGAFGGLVPYSSDILPIHERYFMGGATDLRGFKFRGAGYRDPDDDDLPTGGAAKILVKNEYLYPLFDPISGVVFSDIGALGETPASWQAPRVSVGAGLRFNMKNVQVAVDLAAPIVKQSGDETQFIHFSMQSQF